MAARVIFYYRHRAFFAATCGHHQASDPNKIDSLMGQKSKKIHSKDYVPDFFSEIIQLTLSPPKQRE